MLITLTQQGKDRDAKLPEIAFAPPTTKNRSTGFTPVFLNYGREMPFPLAKTQLPEPDEASAPGSCAEILRQRDAVRGARENLDVTRIQQADAYNQGRKDVEFTVGDVVFRRSHPLSDASKKFAESLAHKWEGRYAV